jgi:hypothetical protein
MFVSLSDNSCIATDIGVYFSDSAIVQNGNGTMGYNPQIVASNVVTSKLGWTKISSCFIAMGGEHYITIGNFQAPNNTSVTTVGSCLTSFTNSSYYYIDDVVLANRSHTLRKDTNFCGNTVSMNLYSSFPNAQNFFWNTSASTSSIYINSPNYYWVKITDSAACFYFTDSFHIMNTPKPTIDLGPDTTLCPNSSFLLMPTHSSDASFIWQNNSTDTFININHTGLYWAKVASPYGCKNSDSITIKLTVPLNFLGNDIHYCDSTAFPTHNCGAIIQTIRF